MLRLVPTLVLLVASTAFAVDPPIPADERMKMLREFAEQVAALDRAITETPRTIALYSRRGDRQLFLGQFAKAVGDFEKMIALDPAQEAPHWRLGIAYYFTGQFAKSARQFEKYHAYDGGDRENGIWKFLGDVKVSGLKPAQRAMLVYTRFDREPFPGLYELFSGAKSTADFFTGIEERKLADDWRVMFFAHYYAGLNEETLGQREKAVALLHQAVANEWGRTAEGGPTYMWQVARLHYEMLAGQKP